MLLQITNLSLVVEVSISKSQKKNVAVEDEVKNLSGKKMAVLVDEEILKNHLGVEEAKAAIEVEVLQELVEIDLIEILVVIEDPQDLEESGEKEDRTKFTHIKKPSQMMVFLCVMITIF